jgi:autotransporter-associated beta strand protein
MSRSRFLGWFGHRSSPSVRTSLAGQSDFSKNETRRSVRRMGQGNAVRLSLERLEDRLVLAPVLTALIEGINFDENSTNTGSLFIPPDPHGTAGRNHVVSVVNTSIEWHTKAGVQQNSVRLGRNSGGSIVGSFFEPLVPANATFDPKVIYDRFADRFVVVTLERTDDDDGSTTGDAADTSRILVAVSDDGDPNGTWFYHAIDAKTLIGGVDRWADYPGFAVDEEAVYITNNMFGFGSSGTFGGVRLWIMDKGTAGGFYSGGAAAVTVHDPYAGGGIATTTQPAYMNAAGPGSTGTFLVSYSGLTSGGIESVQVVRVDNPITAPTFSQQFVSVGDIDNTGVGMPDAPQSGTATTIETNDRRAINAVWQNNQLWMTAQVVPGSGPDTGDATAHWWNLNTTSLAAITVNDQGNAGAEDLGTDTFTFMPSIAVDAAGNMALGFAASNASIFPSAAYTGRTVADAPGTVQSTGTLASGLASYIRTFGGPRNRWGDYSGMVVDPDGTNFWMFNEYAITQGTPTGGEFGRWSTRYGAFSFPVSGAITVGGTGFDDTLTITLSGGAAGTYQLNSNPVVSFSGCTSITFNGSEGNDTLILNEAAALLGSACPITYNGGTNTATGDSLMLQGGTASRVLHTFTSASSGSTAIGSASNAGVVAYTGLEPITDTITATDREFTFIGGAETITISDSGTAGQTMIDSTLGESVTFANPTGSMTVNPGTGDDIVNVTGLGSGFAANLNIFGNSANFAMLGTFDFAPGAGLGNEVDVNPNGELLYIGSGFGQTGLIRVNASNPAAMSSTTLSFGGGVAVDPVTGRYGTTNGGASFRVFNSDDTTFDTEGLTGCGGSVAAGNGTFGISTQCSDTFHLYSQATGSITFTTGGLAVGSKMTYNSATGNFYMNRNPGGGSFFVNETNTATNGFVATNTEIQTANGVTNRLYGAGPSADQITVLNGATHAIFAQTTVANFGGGLLAVNTLRDRLYVGTVTDIQILDGTTLATLGSFTLPDGYAPVRFEMAAGSDRLYVIGRKTGVSDSRIFVLESGGDSDTVTVQTNPINLTGGNLFVTATNVNVNSAVTTTGAANLLASTAGSFASTISAASLTLGGGGTFALGAAERIANTTDVSIATATALNLAGFSETIDALTGSGTVTSSVSGAATLSVGSNDGSGTFSGSIQNGSGTVALTKTGSGTLTLTGSNTYTGTTSINNGTLALAGSSNNNIANSATVSIATGAFLTVAGLSSSRFDLASGQTLSGTGTVSGGTLKALSGSFVVPGTSTGKLNTGNVSLESGSTFTVEVNGSTPGSGHDQLDATGTVTINGATLSASGTITSSPGQEIVLINNDSTDAIMGTPGTFAGLAEGATVVINGVSFTISYAGGTNTNDVVLVQPATFTPGDVFAADNVAARGSFFDVTAGGDFSGVTPFAMLPSRSPGQITWSADLTTAYVTQFNTGSVVAVSASGVVSTFATGIAGPTGIIRTAAGKLLVASFSTGSVFDITAGGDFSSATAFATGLSGPRNFLQIPSSAILVAEQTSGEVTDVAAGGNLAGATPFAFGLSSIADLVRTSSGQIFVCKFGGAPGIFNITAGGDFSAASAFAFGQNIIGLTIDGAGRMLGLPLSGTQIFDVTAGGDFSAATPFAFNLPSSYGESALDTVPSNQAVGEPTDVDAAADSIAEGAANGSTVGVTIQATSAVSYMLTDNAGGRFAIHTTTGVVTVADGSLLNFETAMTHTIMVEASDGLGGTSTASFMIDVTNVDPTTPTDANGAPNTVSSGSPNGTPVGITASSTDPNGPAVSYTLINTAGGRFAIHPSTGVVTVANSGLISGAASYSITVQASDGAGGSAQAMFNINVANTNPIVSGLAVTTTIDENGTVTLTGNITDPDTADTFTLTINWGEGSPQVEMLPAGTTSFSVTHQYLDDNPTATTSDKYTIKVDLQDNNGGSATQTSTKTTVKNVNPVTNVIVGPSSGVVGQSLSFTGSFTDVGTQDTHKVQWNFGDSSPFTPPPFVPTTDSGAMTPSHVWTRTGTFTIRMTIRDDDGGAKFSTKTIVIRSAAIAAAVGDRGAAAQAVIVSTAGEATPSVANSNTAQTPSSAIAAGPSRRRPRNVNVFDHVIELIQKIGDRSSHGSARREANENLIDLALLKFDESLLR